MKESLGNPAQYYPFMSGRFEVAAGLRPFGSDFGNGELDQKLLQIDHEYFRYLENKNSCRHERISKYYCQDKFSDENKKHICKFLSHKLHDEWPQFFNIKETISGYCLLNILTQEKLEFAKDWSFLQSSENDKKYVDGFDALCAQLQEDVALITLNESSGRPSNYLSAVHLCAAGHWSPEDKIGKDFFAVHVPVPHIEKINEKAQQFAETMVHKGPFVRFVWGFATDIRLNHHPIAPQGISQEQWHGRSFLDPKKDQLFIRFERQVTWPMPEINSGLFTIRVGYLKGEEIRKDPEKRQKLLDSLNSMSPESRVYKGVVSSFEVLSEYLKA